MFELAVSPQAQQDELLEDIRRQIASALPPLLILVAVLLMGFAEALRWPWMLSVGAVVLALVTMPAWFLVSRKRSLAIWLLVLGGMATILLAARYYPASALLCLLALPAGLVALVIGARGAIGVAVLTTILVLLSRRWFSAAEGPAFTAALVVTWGTVGMSAISSYLLALASRSLWSTYLGAHEELRAARAQRLELKQTQEDLLQANAELARLSERLTQMYQVANEARRAKEEFVANVSHELRTPLNMIIGFADMINGAPEAYGVELPPSLLADVDVIRRNSQHLASLVDDVLDLSQVEVGQMAVLREWVKLADIAQEAAIAVQPLFEAKKLALTLDVPVALPPLYCDHTRVRQVLLNLMSNAGRFTEQGGVQVHAGQEGNSVVVAVSDTGPGIAPEHQERIFSPFQQVDTSIRRRFGGTGLGLAISKRFVEMHGGRMWLQSTPGQGSTFYFSLPVQEALRPVAGGPARWLSEEYADRQRTRPSRAPKPTLAPRLVVVEPGKVLQHLLGRYLEEYEVVGASTFGEAVAQLSRSPAQALLLNDPVPERAGQLLVQHASELPFGTPAIACWVPGESDAAARLGVARYLLKPVSQESLIAALDALGKPIRSVLLVDDQPEVLQLFGRMLAVTGRGYRVLKAPNGQWALDLLRERRPDVMLLDLVMAEMDGYTVLREKESDPTIRDIPVIAISALDPVHASIMSHSLTLVRSGGLTFRDLLSCVRLWAEVPEHPEPTDPASPGNHPA